VELFTTYGKAVDVKIYQKGDSFVPNSGFIVFKLAESAERVLEDNPIMLHGSHKLVVEKMKIRTLREPRQLSPVNDRQEKEKKTSQVNLRGGGRKGGSGGGRHKGSKQVFKQSYQEPEVRFISKEYKGRSSNSQQLCLGNFPHSFEGLKVGLKVGCEDRSVWGWPEFLSHGDKLIADKMVFNVKVQVLRAPGALADTIQTIPQARALRPLPCPECPVCLDDMKPPTKIIQCIGGHLICEECQASPSVQSCPTCSEEFTGRAVGMEGHLRQLFGDA